MPIPRGALDHPDPLTSPRQRQASPPSSFSSPGQVGLPSLEVGALVWVPCPKGAWRSGVVVASSGGDVTVQTRTLSSNEQQQVSVPQERCHPRNLEYIDVEAALSVQDLSFLPSLHEPLVLQMLQLRFERGLIYTYTGPVLLAVNPFEPMPQLYSSAVLRSFLVPSAKARRSGNVYINSGKADLDLVPEGFSMVVAREPSLTTSEVATEDKVSTVAPSGVASSSSSSSSDSSSDSDSSSSDSDLETEQGPEPKSQASSSERKRRNFKKTPYPLPMAGFGLETIRESPEMSRQVSQNSERSQRSIGSHGSQGKSARRDKSGSLPTVPGSPRELSRLEAKLAKANGAHMASMDSTPTSNLKDALKKMNAVPGNSSSQHSMSGAEIEKQHPTKHRNHSTDAPHVFATARALYESIQDSGKAQTVLVSGESGAGKTETTKFIMRYLALAGNTGEVGKVSSSIGEAVISSVERRVLEAVPLLEALGNAKTLRNENSSRFGKYTELQFGRFEGVPGASLLGARTHTYLLEKARVTGLHDGERCFHIFYQVLAALQLPSFPMSPCMDDLVKQHGMVGRSPRDFKYLASSSCVTLNDMGTHHSESANFEVTLGALKGFGVSERRIAQVVGVMLAVLNMGNVILDLDGLGGTKAVGSADEDPLAIASGLLGVTRESLEAALCVRKLKVPGGEVTSKRTVEQAADGRDALARHLYGALFKAVVRYVNTALVTSETREGCNSLPSIGLLDIFGFEFFENNSFEQFCINFANEVLQGHFTEVIFSHEMELYEQEGIAWNEKDFPDNSAEVELLIGDSKDPLSGMFPMLDEECNISGGTAASWCRKLETRYCRNRLFRSIKHRPGNFEIRHFAGPVEYTSEAFLDKNRDELSAGALECMQASSVDFVREIFEDHGRKFGAKLEATSGRVTRAEAPSVSSEFRLQLQALMESIRATSPHFIRCIKPNAASRPREYDRKSVVEQLRYQGVLHAIAVSRAGYAVRMPHRDAILHYRCLAPAVVKSVTSDQVTVGNTEKLFDVLKGTLAGMSRHFIEVGKTLVFFKQEAMDVLDKAIQKRREGAAVKLQSNRRTVLAKRSLAAAKKATLRLQRRTRVFIACRFVARLRRQRAAVRLQSMYRGHIARSSRGARARALLKLRGWLKIVVRRMRARRAVLERRTNCSMKVQRAWHGLKARRQYSAMQKASVAREMHLSKLVPQWQQRKLRQVRSSDPEALANVGPGAVIAASRALRQASHELDSEAEMLQEEMADLKDELRKLNTMILLAQEMKAAQRAAAHRSYDRSAESGDTCSWAWSWLLCCVSREGIYCPCGFRTWEYQGEIERELVMDLVLQDMRKNDAQNVGDPAAASTREAEGTDAYSTDQIDAFLASNTPRDDEDSLGKTEALAAELENVRLSKKAAIEAQVYDVAERLRLRELALQKQLEESNEEMLKIASQEAAEEQDGDVDVADTSFLQAAYEYIFDDVKALEPVQATSSSSSGPQDKDTTSELAGEPLHREASEPAPEPGPDPTPEAIIHELQRLRNRVVALENDRERPERSSSSDQA